MFDARKTAEGIFQAAVAAVEPGRAVLTCLQREGMYVSAGTAGRIEWTFSLDNYQRIVVVGCGKAAAPMSAAVEERLGDSISAGLVVVKDGYKCGFSSRRIDIVEAGHPVPDERGRAAARAVLDILRRVGAGDLVVAVVSGGGSALWPLPPKGISLDDKQRATDTLLASGADILECNAVRKHISLIKGGLAAVAAAPADVLVLAISDVIGDRLDVIASGPFFPDPSTFSEATAVIRKYNLATEMPRPVMKRLEDGVAGFIAETPKPGHSAFNHVHTVLCATNSVALQAAARKACELGFEPIVLTNQVTGSVDEAARLLCRRIRETALKTEKVPKALISGGETTVTIGKSKGKGGRNMELALLLAIELSDLRDFAFLSCGTDGTDGPTDAAGAIVDGTTIGKARELGLDPREYARRHDSFTFFELVGGLIRTGPTMTNVMDIQVGMVW